MTNSSFTYIIPSWWPWAVACFIVIASIGAWMSLRGPHAIFSKKTRVLLWSLRFVIGLLLLVFILDWRAMDKDESVEKPLIRVLVDQSQSMATKDAPGNDSRFQQADEIVTSTINPIWGDKDRIATAYAGEGLSNNSKAPDAQRSAIGRSLRELLDSSGDQALGAVFLLTDGAASDPAELQSIASLYRSANIPVYPWITGTRSQPDDLRILSAAIHQPSPSQPTTQLEMTIESPGYDGKTTELTISYEGKILHSEAVTLNGAEQTVSLNFVSPHLGCNFYDIELKAIVGETHTANNKMRRACELRRDLIRVLYMEGSAPKETAFLKDALESDPEMSVTCLHLPGDSNLEELAERALKLRGKDKRIFQDDYGREVPSVCHPERGYPTSLKELLKYDVIIDSDIIKEAFTQQQLANTVSFVERFGGGFIMVGGLTSFGAGGYETTVIDKLMPVEIANQSDPMDLIFSPKLTPTGLTHPIMQVASNKKENLEIWTEKFPHFSGANYARRAKPGAHVLAQIEPRYLGQANGTDLVLFAVQEIGRGRTMAFMSDCTESWGTHFETSWGESDDPQKYYRQFWNRTIRWLAEERIANKNGRVSINTPTTRVLPGDVVPITVQALPGGDHSGLDVSMIIGKDSKTSVPMQWNGARHLWEGSFVARAAGDILIEASYRSAEGKTAKTRAGLHVDIEGDEAIAVATRPALMEELARETGGQLVTDENIKQILDTLAEQSSTVILNRVIPIWDKWWVMLPILLLSVLEWFLRRVKSSHKETANA